MRNTVESAVMLDEDDDFVNPDGSCSKAALKVKRNTHEIGKKKVQQEQPKKKVKKSAKRNDKRTKPEKEKKVESRYTADIRRLATRMSRMEWLK
ncbi:hypothetical protein LXL04_011931 [Taraxacum kok-saghyz]